RRAPARADRARRVGLPDHRRGADPRRAAGARARGGRRVPEAGAAPARREHPLTCDHMVTYYVPMDEVFRALADPTRRNLLDELFKEDGQTLTALERRLAMSRFGVMKHLRVLEEAGLVTTRR